MSAKKTFNPLEKFKGYKKLIKCKICGKQVFTEFKFRYYCDDCYKKNK